MNFTREPIVETVITPKEGFKLTIRNSRGSNLEEYSVDAVEVVSFGHSYFFRNREKPKAFILPLSEYEVLETRETRTILKNPQIEKTIKIGKQSKAETPKKEKASSTQIEPKKKQRKRIGTLKKEEAKKPSLSEESLEEKGVPPPPPRKTLLPPPTSLISEQINRYKDYLIAQEPSEEKGKSLKEEDKIEKIDSPTKKEEPQTPPFDEKISYGEEKGSLDLEKEPEETEKIVDISSSTPKGKEE